MTTFANPTFAEMQLKRRDAEIKVLKAVLRDCKEKLQIYYKGTGGLYHGGPIYSDLMDAIDDCLA